MQLALGSKYLVKCVDVLNRSGEIEVGREYIIETTGAHMGIIKCYIAELDESFSHEHFEVIEEIPTEQ